MLIFLLIDSMTKTNINGFSALKPMSTGNSSDLPDHTIVTLSLVFLCIAPTILAYTYGAPIHPFESSHGQLSRKMTKDI